MCHIKPDDGLLGIECVRADDGASRVQECILGECSLAYVCCGVEGEQKQSGLLGR